MAKILARDWTFTLGGTTISQITSFEITQNKNNADTTNFDDAGHMSHIPASVGNVVTLNGFYDENQDTGARDAGQAAVEALADLVGSDGIDTFVMTSPGGNTKTMSVSAKMLPAGGGNDDAESWGCELTVTGVIVNA